MEEAKKRRLTITGFIIVILVFFTGFIYSVFFTQKEDSYWAYFKQRAKESKAAESSKRQFDISDNVILHRDDLVSVGNIKLIYRGRSDGHLLVGVIINSLDPEMEYLHRIPLRQAKEGIRLGGVPFHLLSSSASKLKLQRTIQK